MYFLYYKYPNIPAAVVGFEQGEYQVRERQGSVEVCVGVLGPVGVTLSEDVSVTLLFNVRSLSATGMCYSMKGMQVLIILLKR